MKKMMNKVLTMMIALTMIFTLAVPAFAAEETEGAAPVKLTASQVKAMTPVNVKAVSYTYSKIKVTWDKISGVDGYEVYRATSKNGKYEKAYTAKGGNKTSYINTGRTAGKTYYYKVRGYKKIGKNTCYTRFSKVTYTSAKLKQTEITELYGDEYSARDTNLEWSPVSGASGYKCQINQKKNGKWTGWRSYSYNEDNERSTFTTYNSLLAIYKKDYPDGYVTDYVGDDKNGKPIIKTLPIEEMVQLIIKKNQARIEVTEDDSTYKFRVRPYRNVGGKKVYGPWSDERILQETLNIDEIMAELKQYTIDYAKKLNYDFEYEEDTEGRTPITCGYYIQGMFGIFSVYARQEDVIECYKDNIRRYLAVAQKNEMLDCGFLYILRSEPGMQEDLERNTSDETYYRIWMLY